MDEAARRAATATGRAETEAEKARAEDIVDVDATDGGCGAVARACESARRLEGATLGSISDGPGSEPADSRTRGSWLTKVSAGHVAVFGGPAWNGPITVVSEGRKAQCRDTPPRFAFSFSGFFSRRRRRCDAVRASASILDGSGLGNARSARCLRRAGEGRTGKVSRRSAATRLASARRGKTFARRIWSVDE